MRLYFILISLLFFSTVSAQNYRGYSKISGQIVGRDTMTVVDVAPIYVFPRPVDTRKYAQLIYNLKKVYPIAQEANRLLASMEVHMMTLKTEKARKEYAKQMEQMLKDKYTPILKKMTFSQGKILIKLIDRETSHTSYELVKEFRGGFRAFFWQGMARIFGANLKARYDKEGEDKIIEQLIKLYEAGLI